MTNFGTRWHLLELHEQYWYPVLWRQMVVQTLFFAWTMLPLPPLSLASTAVPQYIREKLKATGCDRLLDLCSGGGGPMPVVAETLQVPVMLTDLYPQVQHWKTFTSKLVSFSTKSVDATAVPSALVSRTSGSKDLGGGVLRTFCLSLHHFSPDMVRAILEDTIRCGNPIVLIEAQERSLRSMLPLLAGIIPVTWLLWVLMLAKDLLFNTAVIFGRNWWHRVLVSVVVPIVPLTVFFDGFVSCLRTYSSEEFLAVTKTCSGSDTFDWAVETRTFYGVPVTFYSGVPKTRTD